MFVPIEAIQSLKWLNKCIICGVNNKHLRIYDLREPNKPRSNVLTKSVFGIALDPLNEFRFASFHEVKFTMILNLKRY